MELNFWEQDDDRNISVAGSHAAGRRNPASMTPHNFDNEDLGRCFRH